VRTSAVAAVYVAVAAAFAGCGSSHQAPAHRPEGSAAAAAHMATAAPKPAHNGGARDYPPAIYPPPRSFPDWGYPSGCPGLRNVRRLGPDAGAGALRAIRRLDGIRSNDRHWADRAYWPALTSDGHRDGDASRPGHHRGNPARASGHASLLAHNCGRAIVRRSWWVTTAPGDPKTHPGLARNYFLLQRRHRWLLWFTTP
jgi:hypothetical protein